MGKDHWDAILASAPLNATAGTVTGKSRGLVSQQEISFEYSWEAPPPLKRPSPKHLVNRDFIDFTGMKVGRLTVLGITAEDYGKDALWACRCVCGRYVGRRARGLKKADAMCNECSYTRHLRFLSSGNKSRERAEAPEARKWTPVAKPTAA